METLEEPPGGNVDIADIKRRYGHRLCLKGSVNTFDVMLTATPEQVEERAKRLIDTCAPRGGFVLSTGDHAGATRPTPISSNWSRLRAPMEGTTDGRQPAAAL